MEADDELKRKEGHTKVGVPEIQKRLRSPGGAKKGEGNSFWVPESDVSLLTEHRDFVSIPIRVERKLTKIGELPGLESEKPGRSGYRLERWVCSTLGVSKRVRRTCIESRKKPTD